MPKDGFDFEDPFELTGMALLTHEDTTNNMAECFIEEFMRMGCGPKQILALFRSPHYLGPNLAYEKRGEPFIRDLIAEVFTRWGKPAVWPDAGSRRHEEVRSHQEIAEQHNLVSSPAATEVEENLTDPMGSPIPQLNA